MTILMKKGLRQVAGRPADIFFPRNAVESPRDGVGPGKARLAIRLPTAHDEGSMTIVMTGVIAVLAALALAVVLIIQSASSAEIASTAADQAALAAAHDLLAGAGSGHPCSLAQHVAQQNGAQVEKCAELASSVQVVVREREHGAIATARAGAPESLPP